MVPLNVYIFIKLYHEIKHRHVEPDIHYALTRERLFIYSEHWIKSKSPGMRGYTRDAGCYLYDFAFTFEGNVAYMDLEGIREIRIKEGKGGFHVRFYYAEVDDSSKLSGVDPEYIGSFWKVMVHELGFKRNFEGDFKHVESYVREGGTDHEEEGSQEGQDGGQDEDIEGSPASSPHGWYALLTCAPLIFVDILAALIVVFSLSLEGLAVLAILFIVGFTALLILKRKQIEGHEGS